MVENDYIMRLTHEMVRTWLKLLFGIDEIKVLSPRFLFQVPEPGQRSSMRSLPSAPPVWA